MLWLVQTELDWDRERDRDRDRENWLAVYYAEPFTLQREWDRDRDQEQDQCYIRIPESIQNILFNQIKK